MFAAIGSMAGTQPFNDWFAPDTSQRHVLGTKVSAVDPYWGQGDFIYIKSADAIVKGSLVMWNGSHNGTLLPSTVGQGFPFGVAMAPMASGTYGWIQVAGRVVYKTGATVAADTVVGVSAAGTVGANANGKQLLGVRNTHAATATVTATALTTNGSAAVVCPAGYDGFFLGAVLTGTGIGAATTVVAALDPDGRTIYTGSAIGTTGDKNSTATGTITLTGTYTGYGSGIVNNPFAQGAIL